MLRSPTLFVLCCACAVHAADAEAPKVGAAADTAWQQRKPEMVKDGWVDFDKDGVKSAFEDTAVAIEARIDDLLKRMTLAEKLGQCWQRAMSDKSPKEDEALLAKGGLGSYLGVDAKGPGLRNSLQRIAVEDSRLGIPLVFGFDTIHGLRTIFPIPLAQSCSWDPTLAERINAVAARESKAVGIDWSFAPMVDIARDPRWGRIAEGNGEDPWLGSLITAGAVKGFQGDDAARPDRIAACLKHYVGYGAAEGGRDYNTTEIGVPALRNVYLPPFKAGVEAGALSLMSAFNCLNGIPASGHRYTLTDVLRGEWKFDGLVVSDWESVSEMINHGYAADRAEAARLGLNAGVDMEMVSDTYVQHVEKLLAQGAVTAQAVDEATRRVLRFKYRCGLFAKPYAATVADPFLRAGDLALAREAAAKSAVLVKNTGDVLPLKSGLRIALVGPYGDSNDLLGCWNGSGLKEDAVTLAKGLTDAVGKERLTIVRGCELEGDRADGIEAAVAAAQAADVVVLAVGEPSKLSGESNSRQTLDLPGVQQQLANRIAATGKPVVTVLIAGRPLAIPALLEQSAALLVAWHGGVQAGPAIADLLTGAVEPTGRLTTSWLRAVGQVPLHYNCLPTGRGFVNQWASHYRDGSREPLLPFGAGLGYTTFTVAPLTLDRASAPMGGTITATATVANTGGRRGTTLVQCYIRDHAASGGARPVRELRGYERVTLDAGATATVRFTLDRKSLGYWLPDGIWSLEPGRFTVWMGLDSATANQAEFTLTP